jgi:HK97 family phage portal protein
MYNGNAYIYGGRRNERNEVESLHILNSANTMPYVDPDYQEVFYSMGDNPMLGIFDVMIPARDIMHIRLFAPRHPLVGVSPIENAAAAIASNAAISAHQAAFFNRMSRPSGVLSTEQKLNREQMLQLRKAWEEQSKQMNTGGIPILSSGIKWEQMSISSQDAQLVDAFNMSVVDIARAFRVPLPMIQHHDQGSTYNNVEQLIGHWLSGGLGFLLEHIELAFDKFFKLPRREFTEFDTQALLRTDFAGKVEGYTKLVQGGLMTPNEARARVDGLPKVDNGDVPIVQQQMVPLGWQEEQAKLEAEKPDPVEPAPVEEVDEEEAKGAAIYQIRKYMQ